MNKERVLELIYTYMPNIILGISIFILFWFFSKLVQYGISNLLKNKNPDTNISKVIASIIKNLIIIFQLIING